MKTTIAVLLIASIASAEGDTPRAPLIDQATELEPGQPAPMALVCLSPVAFVENEQACRSDYNVAKAVRPGGGYVLFPTWGIVATVLGVLALGLSVGIGIDRLLPRQ